MDKFTIPPGYHGHLTPDALRIVAKRLAAIGGLPDALRFAETRRAQRNVINEVAQRVKADGLCAKLPNLSDREQLRRHFLLYFGIANPPGELDRCWEDRTLLFMLDPPRWKDDGEDPAVATKPPSFKELLQAKLGPCEPDPMQELRDLVLSEITTAFGDSRVRKLGKSDAFAAAYGGSVTSAAPSIAKQITFADIEAFSKYMDDTMSKPQRWWYDESGHLDTFRFANLSPSYQSLPKKETTVNTKPLTITTKTFTYVNGVDVNNYSANELYDMIAREESKIRALEAIDNKPVMLQQEIARRKDGIAALVAHLDSITPVPNPVDPTTEAQINDALGV